jgi:hypothetical protein
VWPHLRAGFRRVCPTAAPATPFASTTTPFGFRPAALSWIDAGRSDVANVYALTVRPEGNLVAHKALEQVFRSRTSSGAVLASSPAVGCACARPTRDTMRSGPFRWRSPPRGNLRAAAAARSCGECCCPPSVPSLARRAHRRVRSGPAWSAPRGPARRIIGTTSGELIPEAQLETYS